MAVYLGSNKVDMLGGGGSSDFSTATITVVGDLNAPIPFVMTTEMCSPFDNLVSMKQTIPSGVQVPLYKGTLITEIVGDGISVSGNIEELGDSVYLITGDCTITVS